MAWELTDIFFGNSGQRRDANLKYRHVQSSWNSLGGEFVLELVGNRGAHFRQERSEPGGHIS